MSEVRMCDVERDADCYHLFSVKESGWQRVKSEVVETDENGNSSASTVMLDACPNCSVRPVKRQRSLRAISSAPEAAVSVPHTCTTTTTQAGCLACQVARRVHDLRTVSDEETQEV